MNLNVVGGSSGGDCLLNRISVAEIDYALAQGYPEDEKEKDRCFHI